MCNLPIIWCQLSNIWIIWCQLLDMLVICRQLCNKWVIGWQLCNKWVICCQCCIVSVIWGKICDTWVIWCQICNICVIWCQLCNTWLSVVPTSTLFVISELNGAVTCQVPLLSYLAPEIVRQWSLGWPGPHSVTGARGTPCPAQTLLGNTFSSSERVWRGCRFWAD